MKTYRNNRWPAIIIIVFVVLLLAACAFAFIQINDLLIGDS